jgi:hypothetical protein
MLVVSGQNLGICSSTTITSAAASFSEDNATVVFDCLWSTSR